MKLLNIQVIANIKQYLIIHFIVYLLIIVILISYSNRFERAHALSLYETAAEGEPRTVARVRVRSRTVRIRERNTATRVRVAVRPQDHTGF